jgi:hypothetical protein
LREAGTWARFCWKVICEASSMPSWTSFGSDLNHCRLHEYTWLSGTARVKVMWLRMSLKPNTYSAPADGSSASATPCLIAEGVSPHATGVGFAPTSR